MSGMMESRANEIEIGVFYQKMTNVVFLARFSDESWMMGWEPVAVKVPVQIS